MKASIIVKAGCLPVKVGGGDWAIPVVCPNTSHSCRVRGSCTHWGEGGLDSERWCLMGGGFERILPVRANNADLPATGSSIIVGR